MFRAAELLKIKFQDIKGLQDPVLGQKNHWSHPSADLVQFLHINGNHWVTISNIGEEPGVVNLYDSLQLKPNVETLNQIAQFSKSSCDTLKVKVQNVHIQENSNDCGILAIAFATSLLSGQDPTTVKYFNIRNHLMKCIKTGNMSQFPTTKRCHGPPIHELHYLLECYCRGILEGFPTVQCKMCTLKCHVSCVTGSKNSRKWLCQLCRQFK